MEKWLGQPFGIPMTWRRWALVLQIFLACILLYALLQVELGIVTPKPTKIDGRILRLVVGGFAIYSIFAAVGILRRRAWGYFMEIPVFLVLGLLFAVRSYYREPDRTFPWMNQALAILFIIGVISEVWRCMQTGFRILKSPPASPTSPPLPS